MLEFLFCQFYIKFFILLNNLINTLRTILKKYFKNLYFISMKTILIVINFIIIVVTLNNLDLYELDELFRNGAIYYVLKK